MMIKMIRKNEENTVCSFYIKQEMVRCPAIPDFWRFVDMTIWVEEYISVDFLYPYPRGPYNRNSFDLKT